MTHNLQAFGLHFLRLWVYCQVIWIKWLVYVAAKCPGNSLVGHP